jgi:3'-5' exoribonuclease
VEVYEERPQISVNETSGGLRRCSPSEYDIREFIPALEETRIKELFAVIKKEIDAIENPFLKELLVLFFNDSGFVKNFMESPSAMTHHHNYVGGNLEHTVGVVRLCHNICGMYPGINKDLVITGAILHDVGKLQEYKFTAAIDKTDEGNFIGHIVIGDRWIREQVVKIREKGKDFPKELVMHLSHLILSHHGKYEWGSPRLPKTIEACVLHQADLMDSQVKNYMQYIETGKQASDDDWAFVYDADIGRRRLIYLGER